MTDFSTQYQFDAVQLEDAMKERWGNPDALNSVIPPDPNEPNEPVIDDETDPQTEPEPTEPVTDPNEPTEPEPEPEPTPGEDEGGPVNPPDVNPPAPVPPTPSDYIDLGDGRRLSRAQLEAYLQFDQRLSSDANLLNYLRAYGSTPPGPSPVPVAPTPDPRTELDLDDPNVKFLYDQYQELQRQVAQQSQVLTLSQQQQMQRQEVEVASLVNRATKSFQVEHKLSDPELEQVREVASRINAIDSYMSGIHPITGAQVRPDPIAAVETSLSIAMASIPSISQKAQQQQIQRQLDNKNRKKNLNKVSGSSGSVPRTTPKDPATRHDRLAAMTEEVRTMMFGQEA